MSRDNAINIKVEVYGGACITDAGKQAIQLSERMGIPVYFEFNNITCVCYPEGSDHETLVKEYHKALLKDNQYKFATSRK